MYIFSAATNLKWQATVMKEWTSLGRTLPEKKGRDFQCFTDKYVGKVCTDTMTHFKREKGGKRKWGSLLHVFGGFIADLQDLNVAI